MDLSRRSLYFNGHPEEKQEISRFVQIPIGKKTGKSSLNTMFSLKPTKHDMAADPIVERMTRPQLEKSIANTTKLMKEAAKNLDFLQAAQYRDEIIRLQKELELKDN